MLPCPLDGDIPMLLDRLRGLIRRKILDTVISVVLSSSQRRSWF